MLAKIIYKKLLILGVLFCSLSVNASPVSSTEDWERREVFVDESALMNIDSVLDKGSWSSDGQTGKLKFLLSKEASGANKLYVQWLSEEDDSVAYTVSVREFNIAPEYALELPACLNDVCTLSKIQATHVYEETNQIFVLNLIGLGRYSVGLFKQ